MLRICLLLAWFGPVPPAAGEPRVIYDVDYLGVERAEKAGLCLPAEPPAGTRDAAVLIIHGGGWVGGEKCAAREINIGTTLARHGYFALSINDPLAPRGNPRESWPQNIRDCKAAVRWLLANAERYGINPTHHGVIGGSAGGHLASLLGVTSRGAPGDVPGHGAEDSARVSAAVDLYGPISLGFGPIDAASDLATSPLTDLDRGDPPFLLIHGTADTTVNVGRSREFAAALAKAGMPHELVILEGAPHSFDFQPAPRVLRPLVLAFFDRYRRTCFLSC